WIVKGSTRRARRTSWIECPEALLLPSADRRTFGVLGVVADFVLIKRVGNHAEPANQAGFALFENNPHASPTRIGAKSTFNGRFRRDRRGRRAWAQETATLEDALQRYGIEAKRVIYLGADTKETRTYASESADLLRRFFALYRVRQKGVVFSDNGAAFFLRGVSALEALGFARHVPYPAPVHQYPSPNDNRLHGAAKTRWRNSGVDFKDDVESSLCLLQHLDTEIAAHGASWFRRNILELTAESANELIRGRPGQRSQVDADRLHAYRSFAGIEVEMGPEQGVV